jgi:leucyl/phenylalanyl-tRNA--protein transferase
MAGAGHLRVGRERVDAGDRTHAHRALRGASATGSRLTVAAGRTQGTGGLRRLETGLLLRAYAAGLFPMADTREAEDVFWVEPRRRGILPLDAFHLPRSLAKVLKQERFRHSADRAFEAVIGACAEEVPGRQQSWINEIIRDAYCRLNAEGHAHSIETWNAEGELVGGLYGVRIGAAFFGESMFSRATDASKAALAHLVARLVVGGFRLLDTQFLTSHLSRFGGVEVKRAQYLALLADAVKGRGDWRRLQAVTVEPPGVAPQTGAALQPGVAAGGDTGAAGGGDSAAVGFAARARFPAEVLSGAARGIGGPSGKRIVQLLSQTS